MMRTLIPLLLHRPRLRCPPWRDDGPVTRSSAIAILAKPALPPDFPYFPYVNPNAPKGGDVTLVVGRHLRQLQSVHTARHLDARHVGLLGDPARRLRLRFHRRPHLGKPADLVGRRDSTGYGHLAQTIELPADKMWVAIRPAAGGEILRWHAGHRRGCGVDLSHAARSGTTELPHPDGGREGRGGGRPASRGVPLQVER